MDYAAEGRVGAEEAAEAAAPAAAPRGPYKPRNAQPAVVATPAPPDPEARKRNAKGELVFDDYPEFRPRLTPRQVIASGTWGGIYFNPRGGKPGIYGRDIAVNHKEFPASWFAGVDPKLYLARRYDASVNKYGVKAGADQAAWESSGWIKRELDPRGWFQWYCRFYMGRRCDDDERQIGRWSGVAGPKGRWKRALLNKVVASNARWDDAAISPVIRQTLLHWAFEITEADVLAHAK